MRGRGQGTGQDVFGVMPVFMGEASAEISQKLIIKRTRVEHKTRKGWMRAF